MKKMYTNFFAKNLSLFLIPLLIPLFLLGSLSINITQRYVKEEINTSNMNMLVQTKENIEVILSELDSLNLNFSTNPEIIVGLKRILRNTNIGTTIDDYSKLTVIKNFVDAPSNAKPYIHSIYVYFDNPHHRFITTTSGLTTFDEFYDTSWLNSFENRDNNSDIWTEIRTVKRYAFEKSGTKVLTIYRKLYSTGIKKSDGIIVLNIYSSYIENLLNNFGSSYSQGVLIVDANNRTIFRNNLMSKFSDIDVKNIINYSGSLYTSSLKNSYAMFKITSKRYGWSYISIIPHSVLYTIPIRLSIITSVFLIASFILGLLLTYYLTMKNYNNIKNIISIIESAETGRELPPLPSRVRDVYGYIIHNVLKTFIEQSYLKLQLSEKRYKMQAMELLALQSQMNPHFLFNTLETINWKTLSLTGKPNDVNKMIGNLSDILKYSLDSRCTSVTFDEEIRNGKCYIDIMKVRYKDKFDVLWVYDDSVLNYKIVKFVLQPLIENSIYHGIKLKEGQSLIKIRLQHNKGFVKISIIDNGLGIKKDRLLEIKKKLNSVGEPYERIGLFNTNKRLQLTFEDKFELNIRSKYGLGTAIYIKIPTQLI